jgi:excisionase family DNA binding protein
MNKAKLDKEWEIVRKAHRLIDEVLAEFGPFVSLAEASRKTGVPLQTISEAAKAGRLPALKVLGRSWVRVSAVRAYAEKADDPYEALRRQLVEDGVLADAKPRRQLRDFQPVPYTGKSGSEIVIEDRR